MQFNKKNLLLIILFLFTHQLLQAASFEIYFTKLIQFEGKGFGIQQNIWGYKTFTKDEAYHIYKKNYWDKYHASLFQNQEVAEVLIDHLINAGAGKSAIHIKAFEAILGVPQDGILSIADVKAANSFPQAALIVNPFVNYRLLHYKSVDQNDKYKGWISRAKAFIKLNEAGENLANYLILPEMLADKIKNLTEKEIIRLLANS